MAKLELENERLARTPWFYTADGSWWLMWPVLPQIGRLVLDHGDDA